MARHSVSIIIPVYNIIAFLDEAIKSVASQNLSPLEIIVVNDGSNEQASAGIAAICSTYPTVRIIQQVNKGQALARFAGIQQAQGDYIMFLDADDMLLPGALAHLVEFLESNPSSIAAYAPKVRIDRNGKFLDRITSSKPQHIVSGDIVPALLRGVPLLSNGNICMKREAIAQVVFPQNMQQGEDWVTWCRLAMLGDIHYAGDRPVLCIRTHDHNISSKVLDNPSQLLHMLSIVFEDPIFMSRIGMKALADYRKEHLKRLRAHLSYSYRDRGQRLRAFQHKMLRRFGL